MPPAPSSRSSATTSSRSRPKQTRSRSGPATVRSLAADVEALATPAREATAWAITDAWGERDGAALIAAAEAELERREPFAIAVRLASHVTLVRSVKLLAAEGVGARDIAKRVKVHEFRVRKAIGHADRYSQEELDAALVRLAALDAALKGASRLSNAHELTRALAELTRAGEDPGVEAELAARDEARGLRLLARRSVAVERAARRRAVDPLLELLVRRRDAVGIAVRDRGLEPPRERLHRRAVAQVLEPLPCGRSAPASSAA